MLKRIHCLKCLAVFITLLAGARLALVMAFPNPAPPWLSIKGTGSDAEAQPYYNAVSAPATFAAWQAAYGFSGANDVRAVYYNAGDLGFGREMHCRQVLADVAC